MLSAPKFKVGDRLLVVESDVYKGCVGTVTKMDKEFREVDERGNFSEDPQTFLGEHDLAQMRDTRRIDEDTFVVHYAEIRGANFTAPAHDTTYKVYGWGYTLHIPNSPSVDNALFLESELKTA